MAKYKPADPTRPPTWIRVEDEGGQFDHRADLPLPEGQSVVEDYPEHISETARAPKAKAEIKIDRERLKNLAKDLDVPIGNKSDGQLAQAIADAQAELAAQQPATEAEANLQNADDESETGSNDNAGAPGEGSE